MNKGEEHFGDSDIGRNTRKYVKVLKNIKEVLVVLGLTEKKYL